MPDFTMRIYDETVPGWVAHYPRPAAHTHPISQITNLQTTLDGKIDKRTGILKSGGIVDTTGLFPYAITTAATAIGFEYNILLNASKKGYTFTQSGTGQISVPAGLCDGMLSPQYSGDGVNPADPYVLLIEGLPNTHTQTGGLFGWTSRYWNPTKYKVEAYDSYQDRGWKTLVDEQTGVTTKDLVIPIYPSFSGSLTKFRITIYDSNGSVGANGHRRWGLSEIFFIHPESQSTHQYLDVEWAKKLSTARQINGVNFDGSGNITVYDSTKLPLAGGTLAGDLLIDDGTSTSPELKFKNQSFIVGIDLFNNTKRLRFIDRTAGVERAYMDMATGLFETYGDIKENGQRVYSPNNKPSMAALGGRTQAEITSEIAAALAALVDSSPGTLDTLNELAAALGDDPNFATTMTNALAGKLNNNNPVFTGIMIGPDIRGNDTTNQFWIRNRTTSPTAQIQLTDESGGTIYLWGSSIEISGHVNMNGKKIASLGAPEYDSEAATKLYVDTGIESRAASSHPHGNITNNGEIVDNDPVASGDRILFADASNSGKIIAMSMGLTSTHNNEYLRRDGTWTVPPDTNTTYGAFVGATISVNGSAGLVPQPLIANRLEFLRGDGTWGLPTKSDVGLSSVYNYGLATTEQAVAGAVNTVYMTPVRVKEAIQNINPTPYFGAISTTQTLNIDHANRFIRCTNGSAITITIPLGVYQIGDEIHILRAGAGEVTITNATSVSIFSEGSATANAGKKRINLQMQAVTLKMFAANQWHLFGALKT